MAVCSIQLGNAATQSATWPVCGFSVFLAALDNVPSSPKLLLDNEPNCRVAENRRNGARRPRPGRSQSASARLSMPAGLDNQAVVALPFELADLCGDLGLVFRHDVPTIRGSVIAGADRHAAMPVAVFLWLERSVCTGHCCLSLHLEQDRRPDPRPRYAQNNFINVTIAASCPRRWMFQTAHD